MGSQNSSSSPANIGEMLPEGLFSGEPDPEARIYLNCRPFMGCGHSRLLVRFSRTAGQMSHSYTGSISRIPAKSYKFRSGISIAPSRTKRRDRLGATIANWHIIPISSDCVSRAWLHMILSVKEH